jgi:hypothetical protein
MKVECYCGKQTGLCQKLYKDVVYVRKQWMTSGSRFFSNRQHMTFNDCSFPYGLTVVDPVWFA